MLNQMSPMWEAAVNAASESTPVVPLVARPPANRCEELFNQLTVKRRLFCLAYMENGCNGDKAALAVGYSLRAARQSAKRLLSNPIVAEYLSIKIADLAKVAEASFEWKLKKLVKCVNRSVPEDEETEIKVNDAVNAIAELNKMQGHYAPTKSLSANLTVTAEDAQVRELVEKFSRDY